MAAQIPVVQTNNADFRLFQSQLSKVLQPILSNPINFGTRLSGVSLLANGVNTVNHNLNRTLQGWFLVRNRADAVVWDSQDSNTNQTQTLLLNTSADVTVDIWVF